MRIGPHKAFVLCHALVVVVCGFCGWCLRDSTQHTGARSRSFGVAWVACSIIEHQKRTTTIIVMENTRAAKCSNRRDAHAPQHRRAYLFCSLSVLLGEKQRKTRSLQICVLCENFLFPLVCDFPIREIATPFKS